MDGDVVAMVAAIVTAGATIAGSIGMVWREQRKTYNLVNNAKTALMDHAATLMETIAKLTNDPIDKRVAENARAEVDAKIKRESNERF